MPKIGPIAQRQCKDHCNNVCTICSNIHPRSCCMENISLMKDLATNWKSIQPHWSQVSISSVDVYSVVFCSCFLKLIFLYNIKMLTTKMQLWSNSIIHTFTTKWVNVATLDRVFEDETGKETTIGLPSIHCKYLQIKRFNGLLAWICRASRKFANISSWLFVIYYYFHYEQNFFPYN